jgi:hypothetical protein
VKARVETPEGPGRLTAAAEVAGGWRVRVELSKGGVWIGAASDLLAPDDTEAFRNFLRALGEDRKPRK